MKAMILAAGLGTRLRGITQHTPKCLVEAGGMTMLEHTMMALKRAGVTSVIINIHHFAESIVDFVSEHGIEGLDVQFSRERDLLGTGGGLLNAASFFRDSEIFIVHNADIFSTVDLSRVLDRHSASGALATLVVMECPTSRPLYFSRDGMLSGWRTEEEIHPAGLCTEDLKECSFCGIQVVSRELLPVLAEEKPPFSIISSYMKASMRGEPVLSFPVEKDYWIDAGTPENLQALRAYLAENTGYWSQASNRP